MSERKTRGRTLSKTDEIEREERSLSRTTTGTHDIGDTGEETTPKPSTSKHKKEEEQTSKESTLPCSIIKPEMWQKFNGNFNQLHPMTYLNNIIRLTQDIDDNKTVMNLIRLTLTEKALEWFEMVSDKCQNAEEFKREFVHQYWSRSQQDKLRIELLTGKYREGLKNRENYACELYNKCKHIKDLEERNIVLYLLNHFTMSDNSTILCQNINTIEELMEILRRLDTYSVMNRREQYNNYKARTDQNYVQFKNDNNYRYKSNLNDNNYYKFNDYNNYHREKQNGNGYNKTNQNENDYRNYRNHHNNNNNYNNGKGNYNRSDRNEYHYPRWGNHYNGQTFGNNPPNNNKTNQVNLVTRESFDRRWYKRGDENNRNFKHDEIVADVRRSGNEERSKKNKGNNEKREKIERNEEKEKGKRKINNVNKREVYEKGRNDYELDDYELNDYGISDEFIKLEGREEKLKNEIVTEDNKEKYIECLFEELELGKEYKEKLKSIMLENSITYNDKITFARNYEHKILIDDNQPLNSKHYPIPFHYREQVNFEINKLLEQQIIEG
nr:glycosyltransferase-like protein gnt13 [Onthophagus taurus]